MMKLTNPRDKKRILWKPNRELATNVLWIDAALVTKHMIKMIYNINLNIQPKDDGLDTRENSQLFFFELSHPK